MNGSMQDAVDSVFAEFGVDATYTPQGGGPVTVRVLRSAGDEILGFGETRLHTASNIFEIRRSDPVTPQDGDMITIEGENFIIQGSPQVRDTDRLVWTMEAYPA